MSETSYVNPLGTRYASKAMQYLFSEENKFLTFRKLWIALAEAEMELQLGGVNKAQVDDLKAHMLPLNLDVAKEREKITRHDVMAQVYAYGEQAKIGAPIIHLGATSCYVGDNTDLIIYHDALEIVKAKVARVAKNLAVFSNKYKSLACLGKTHFQTAQMVTVGKRGTLWLCNFVEDYRDIEAVLDNYRLRGVKGTTGTCASFLELADGDEEKVIELNKRVVKKMGYNNSYSVTGQTYPRKFDYKLLSLLSGVAQSAYKFAEDLRILQGIKEMEEPFEKGQIGSSAMAYKRNPMRSERICSLARYVLCMPQNASITASTQWFERTLDDSANKRLSMAEGFLATDGILDLMINVTDNMVVYEKVIASHIAEELPFMATENIIMECVKAGLSRQDVHEKIRVHSMEAAKTVKEEGKPNDLIERIKKDPYFSCIADKYDEILDSEKFVGMCARQVDDYLSEVKDVIAEGGKRITETSIEV